MNNRPGVRTSEFWVMVVSAVAGVIIELTDIKLDVAELSMIFGPAMAYTVSRGMAKIKTP